MNLCLWIITLIAFLLVVFIISYKEKVPISDSMPVCMGAMILVLYLLAFFRGMEFISLLGTGILVFTGVFLIKQEASDRKKYLGEFCKYYLSSQSILIVVAILAAAILTSRHVATWWDDLNYWATDAKALYYLNGFPGKYGNVAPEFGDYPPGIQIMKWCFMKLSHNYNEGLSFSGYYVMGITFLLPLFSVFRNKKPLWQPFGLISIIFIPGVCNRVWCEGTCADIVLGVIFGSLLIAIMDFRKAQGLFYYFRIFVFGSVLILCKSAGFQWGIYACILLIILYFLYRKEKVEIFNGKNKKYLWFSILGIALIQGSWWGYCLLTRRIAKLTSSGVHLATGNFSLSTYFNEKIGLFLEGFAFYPMHTDKTIGVDISSMGMFILILLGIVLLGITKSISKKEAYLLFFFSFVMGVLVYSIILVGHLSVFATETQYDTANVMAISISRYASPFTIGMLMLLVYIIISHVENKPWIHVLCMVFVLISTDYSAMFEATIGYRSKVDENIKARQQVVDASGWDYVELAQGMEKLYGHRVLYLRDENTIHWIKDTYISYFVSPVATYYDGFDAETYTTDLIKDIILTDHAYFLYVDPQEDSGKEIFEPLMKNEDFNYGTIYQVVNEGNDIRLVNVY